MNTKRSTGFTIVELLVVIVVLGVLMTIGIGSYAGYQNRTKLEKKRITETRLNRAMAEYVTKAGHYPTDFSADLSSDENIEGLVPDVVSTSSCNAREKVCVRSSYYNSLAVDKWSGYDYTYWLNDANYWIAVRKVRTPPNLSGAGSVTTTKRNCGTGATAIAWDSCTPI